MTTISHSDHVESDAFVRGYLFGSSLESFGDEACFDALQVIQYLRRADKSVEYDCPVEYCISISNSTWQEVCERFKGYYTKQLVIKLTSDDPMDADEQQMYYRRFKIRNKSDVTKLFTTRRNMKQRLHSGYWKNIRERLRPWHSLVKHFSRELHTTSPHLIAGAIGKLSRDKARKLHDEEVEIVVDESQPTNPVDSNNEEEDDQKPESSSHDPNEEDDGKKNDDTKSESSSVDASEEDEDKDDEDRADDSKLESMSVDANNQEEDDEDHEDDSINAVSGPVDSNDNHSDCNNCDSNNKKDQSPPIVAFLGLRGMLVGFHRAIGNMKTNLCVAETDKVEQKVLSIPHERLSLCDQVEDRSPLEMPCLLITHSDLDKMHELLEEQYIDRPNVSWMPERIYHGQDKNKGRVIRVVSDAEDISDPRYMVHENGQICFEVSEMVNVEKHIINWYRKNIEKPINDALDKICEEKTKASNGRIQYRHWELWSNTLQAVGGSGGMNFGDHTDNASDNTNSFSRDECTGKEGQPSQRFGETMPQADETVTGTFCFIFKKDKSKKSSPGSGAARVVHINTWNKKKAKCKRKDKEKDIVDEIATQLKAMFHFQPPGCQKYFLHRVEGLSTDTDTIRVIFSVRITIPYGMINGQFNTNCDFAKNFRNMTSNQVKRSVEPTMYSTHPDNWCEGAILKNFDNISLSNQNGKTTTQSVTKVSMGDGSTSTTGGAIAGCYSKMIEPLLTPRSRSLYVTFRRKEDDGELMLKTPFKVKLNGNSTLDTMRSGRVAPRLIEEHLFVNMIPSDGTAGKKYLDKIYIPGKKYSTIEIQNENDIRHSAKRDMVCSLDHRQPDCIVLPRWHKNGWRDITRIFQEQKEDILAWYKQDPKQRIFMGPSGGGDFDTCMYKQEDPDSSLATANGRAAGLVSIGSCKPFLEWIKMGTLVNFFGSESFVDGVNENGIPTKDETKECYYGGYARCTGVVFCDDIDPLTGRRYGDQIYIEGDRRTNWALENNPLLVFQIPWNKENPLPEHLIKLWGQENPKYNELQVSCSTVFGMSDRHCDYHDITSTMIVENNIDRILKQYRRQLAAKKTAEDAKKEEQDSVESVVTNYDHIVKSIEDQDAESVQSESDEEVTDSVEPRATQESMVNEPIVIENLLDEDDDDDEGIILTGKDGTQPMSTKEFAKLVPRIHVVHCAKAQEFHVTPGGGLGFLIKDAYIEMGESLLTNSIQPPNWLLGPIGQHLLAAEAIKMPDDHRTWYRRVPIDEFKEPNALFRLCCRIIALSLCPTPALFGGFRQWMRVRGHKRRDEEDDERGNCPYLPDCGDETDLFINFLIECDKEGKKGSMAPYARALHRQALLSCSHSTIEVFGAQVKRIMTKLEPRFNDAVDSGFENFIKTLISVFTEVCGSTVGNPTFLGKEVAMRMVAVVEGLFDESIHDVDHPYLGKGAVRAMGFFKGTDLYNSLIEQGKSETTIHRVICEEILKAKIATSENDRRLLHCQFYDVDENGRLINLMNGQLVAIMDMCEELCSMSVWNSMRGGSRTIIETASIRQNYASPYNLGAKIFFDNPRLNHAMKLITDWYELDEDFRALLEAVPACMKLVDEDLRFTENIEIIKEWLRKNRELDPPEAWIPPELRGKERTIQRKKVANKANSKKGRKKAADKVNPKKGKTRKSKHSLSHGMDLRRVQRHRKKPKRFGFDDSESEVDEEDSDPMQVDDSEYDEESSQEDSDDEMSLT